MKRVSQSALLLALVAAMFGAGPAAATAATPPTSDYGNTVVCRYKAPGNGPSFNFRLKKLVVTAPVVYAHSGTQTVGWRFVVTRSKSWGGDPWKVTYRSPVQKRKATMATAAAFDAKEVGVAIPDVENVVSVQYHVTLKLFWYRANGSVQSQTSYLMPYMIQHTRFDDGEWGNHCAAGFYQGP